jgi:hypothetical protein
MAIRTDKIEFIKQGTPEVEGSFGDTIQNTSAGVWDFGSTTGVNITFVGYESLAQAETTLWVDASFPDVAPFYSTIQNAIDAIGDSSSTKKYVINILAGRYDGFHIQNKSYITVQGIGPVTIKAPDTINTDENLILIDTSTDCFLKNLILEGTSFNFNTVATVKLIKVIGSIDIDGLYFNFPTQTRMLDYVFKAIDITASSKNSFIKNCMINFVITEDVGCTTEEVAGINFSDVSAARKLKIENVKIKIVRTDLTGSVTGTIDAINFDTANTTAYFSVINNSEFELSSDNAVDPSVFTTNGSYDKVAITNCFTNTGLNINLIDNNNLTDSNFVVTIP